MRQPEIPYLFIDGGYLRSFLCGLSRDLFNGEKVTVEPVALSKGFQKVFYYDCVPERKENESEPGFKVRLNDYEDVTNSLRATPGFHVIEGSTRGKKQRQKEVDVAIAVDMLTH